MALSPTTAIRSQWRSAQQQRQEPSGAIVGAIGSRSKRGSKLPTHSPRPSTGRTEEGAAPPPPGACWKTRGALQVALPPHWPWPWECGGGVSSRDGSRWKSMGVSGSRQRRVLLVVGAIGSHWEPLGVVGRVARSWESIMHHKPCSKAAGRWHPLSREMRRPHLHRRQQHFHWQRPVVLHR